MKIILLFSLILFIKSVKSTVPKGGLVASRVANIENKNISPLSKAQKAYESANNAYIKEVINCPTCASLENLKQASINAKNNYLKEFESYNSIKLNTTKVTNAEDKAALFEELYAKLKVLHGEVPADFINEYNSAVNNLAELKAGNNSSIQIIIKQLSSERIERLVEQSSKETQLELTGDIDNLKQEIAGTISGESAKLEFQDLMYKLEWNRPLSERSSTLSEKPSSFRPALSQLEQKAQDVLTTQKLDISSPPVYEPVNLTKTADTKLIPTTIFTSTPLDQIPESTFTIDTINTSATDIRV